MNIRSLLIELDARFDILAGSLVDFLDMGFDPDAVFTPCESVLVELVEALGFDYADIRLAARAYRQEMEREAGA
jgi:hypothetical protein